MAISLASLRRATAILPPRLLIYGPPGMGKTTLASEFPAPVFIQVEDGTPYGLEIDTFGHLKDYRSVWEALNALTTEEHDFQTVVIDSLDKLEPLVWQQVCEDQTPKWSSIEDPGYGKGYKAADLVWKEIIDFANILRSKGIYVIFIAHSKVGRFDDPTSISYSQYDIRLHDRAVGLFEDEVDAILFLNQDVSVRRENPEAKKERDKGRAIAEGGRVTWIYTTGPASITAKNRMKLLGMPDRIVYKLGYGYAELSKYFPNSNSADAREAAE